MDKLNCSLSSKPALDSKLKQQVQLPSIRNQRRNGEIKTKTYKQLETQLSWKLGRKRDIRTINFKLREHSCHGRLEEMEISGLMISNRGKYSFHRNLEEIEKSDRGISNRVKHRCHGNFEEIKISEGCISNIG